jgi:Mn2+/Fe2+ NRAMP family transporter
VLVLILVLVLVLEVREARDSDSDSEASPRNVRNNTQQSIRTTRQETTQKAASEMSAAIFESYVTIMFTIRVNVIIIIYVFEDMYVQARKAFYRLYSRNK